MGDNRMADAFVVSVYRNGSTDCTNGGVSSAHDELLVLCNSGNVRYDSRATVDLDDPPENLMELVCSHGTVHLVPVRGVDDGCIGWMFGGNYAATSDAPFHRALSALVDDPYVVGAVPIHDRQESYSLYERLSR